MITEEPGNMEAAMMNSDQKVLKEQGLGSEPKAQDHETSPPLPPSLPLRSPLDDERSSAVSTSEVVKNEEVEPPFEKFGSTLEKLEVLDEQQSVHDQGESHIVGSEMKEERTEAAPPSTPQSPTVVSRQVGQVVGVLNVENSQVSPVGLANAPPVGPDEVGTPAVSSPGKKRSKGSRSWKKNSGKKKHDKDSVEAQSAGAAMHNSRDAGTQTDQQELERNAGAQSDPGRDYSGADLQRAAEGDHELGFKSALEEQVHAAEEDLHGNEFASAVVGPQGDVLAEERHDKVDPSFSSLKALRSFGKWADVSEDIDTRAPDTEPDRIGSQNASVDKSSDRPEQEHRGPQHGFEGTLSQGHQGLGVSHSQDVRASARISPSENDLRGKSQLRVYVSPREDIREGARSSHKEQELRGKSPRSPYESPRSRHDLRADSWNNHKEQDLRGKTQLGRESLSQASRELNWRRRPMETRLRQDTPKSTGKLGLDGEPKKEEHQDFRSRSQYGAEPQATHKNWIPRRGLHTRGEGEGRSEQSKARGKGKQGRDAEAQNQFKQKFEADLRIKQEELFQKSKLSLKEIQKQKRIEQTRKGEDQLEMELNKNLVYEDGELFYLNI
ncbi:unnamed protein product [Calypogeia fissa]